MLIFNEISLKNKLIELYLKRFEDESSDLIYDFSKGKPLPVQYFV